MKLYVHVSLLLFGLVLLPCKAADGNSAAAPSKFEFDSFIGMSRGTCGFLQEIQDSPVIANLEGFFSVQSDVRYILFNIDGESLYPKKLYLRMFY